LAMQYSQAISGKAIRHRAFGWETSDETLI
jgi:hypothetical protein